MQTGEFRAMVPGDEEAMPAPPRSSPKLLEDARFDAGDQALAFRSPSPASPSLADAPPRLPTTPFEESREPALPAAVVVGQISSREYESLLGEWEAVLGLARKKLTTRSPIFKSLAAQLARVRALDTCMAYGLTPAGGRAASRMARLLQGEGMHIRLGLPPGLAEGLEDAFSQDYPGFLASIEALIVTVYDFRPVLPDVQFRLRDRLPAVRPGVVDLRPRASDRFSDGRETTLWADAAEIDEVALRLMIGTIQLAADLSGLRIAVPESPRFGEEGKLAYPAAPALGDCDPFLAYCALMWRARTPGQANPSQAFPAADQFEDPESHLMRLLHLTPEDKLAMKAKYLVWLGADGKPSPLIPGLGDVRLREGWGRGFERGYMAEIGRVFDTAATADLDRRLLELLAGIQVDIDLASASLEAEKMRLIRERVLRVVD
jgi:hypothetical protein